MAGVPLEHLPCFATTLNFSTNSICLLYSNDNAEKGSLREGAPAKRVKERAQTGKQVEFSVTWSPSTTNVVPLPLGGRLYQLAVLFNSPIAFQNLILCQ